MGDKASTTGWVVCVRVWGTPDEFYFAAISDPHDAEEQVRGALPSGVQAAVQATRELSKDEVANHQLEIGKIIHAPK